MALLGGAECSSSFNPLSHLSKHVQNDSSLQRDRLVARQSAPFSQSLRTRDAGSQMQAEDAFNDFSRGSSIPQFGLDLNHSGAMSAQFRPQTFETDPGWAAEYLGGSMNSSSQIADRYTTQPPVDVVQPNNLHPSHTMQRKSAQAPISQANLRYGLGSWLPGNYVGMGQPQSQQSSSMSSSTSVNAPRISDGDWESMFSTIDASMETDLPASQSAEKTVDDVIRSIVNASLEEDKLWDQTNDAPSSIQSSPTLQVARHEPAYAFSPNNPFETHQSPFEDGLRIVANGDNLSLAILAFEAACQQNPEHIEAWRMLGSTNADNSDESAAMQALQEALRLEPDNLDTLMALAVSYTNNGYDGKAYEHLEQWVLEKYPDVRDAVEPLDDSKFPSLFTRLERVKGLFLAAVQLTPNGQIDTTLQVGLGILCFSGESYQMAADCFSVALSSNNSVASLGSNTQMDLHLLWNRLGAALANMGRYDEAIEAYQMALAVNTNFVRAHHNLAVLYHNIHKYTEAAEHSLEMLSRQKAGFSVAQKRQADGSISSGVGSVESRGEELYALLRKILRHLGRWDLEPGVGPSMDLSRYRRELFG